MSRRRWLAVAAVLVGAVVVAASPIAYVETQCRIAAPAAAPSPSAFGIADEGYRRAEGDSFMSFPEWYIVYAYADLAAVTRQTSESSFDYLASVFGFWRSLCRSTQAAERLGPVSADQRVTDYIIGVSFTLEMAVIGGWERTIGAIAVLARGGQPTAEDRFALSVADDYAGFLQQTPWYRYPFWPTLRRFWSETPFGRGSLLRGLERRLALTLEYGGKELYAIPIGWLAGVSPADLKISSVVEGLTDADFAAEPRLQKVRDLGSGDVLVESPRYQQYTDILRKLAERGRRVVEIAGNRHILTTVIAPEGAKVGAGAPRLFSVSIQSRPGWRRFGYVVDVGKLTDQIRSVAKLGFEFEHAYDY